MPAYGVEILRHKAELHETKERIQELLEKFNFEDEEKVQQEKARRKSISKAASRFERQTSPEDALEVRQKLYELFDSLHLQERYDMLSQVSDWFVGHTPAAQKDIAILDRADKECLQRECERAWTALATDDTIRKKERNTIRQVHQFVQAVADKHHENRADLGDSDDEESVVRFEPRLISLTDEEMAAEVEALRQKVRQKEQGVVLILLNIAERGRFMTGNRIEYIKANFEKEAIDLVAEQEKIWLVAEEELRKLEEHKDLIYETLGYVRSSAKAHEVRPPSEHLLEYLHKKRSEVQEKHGPAMLAKRMEDYGKDLEPPNTDKLTALREEATELNNRIQRAAACKIRVSSEAALHQDYDRKVDQLANGVTPQAEVLDQLEVVMDPTKDFAQENMGDDEHYRRHAADVEKLSKKKAELLSMVGRMREEQLSFQRDWLEGHAALQASEMAAAEQERLLQMAQETLRTLQEHRDLAAATMGCARGSLAPSPLSALHTSRHPSASVSRPPSGSASLAKWVPRRSILEGGEEDIDDVSSPSRQTSGSKESLPPEGASGRGRRRSLFVDPSDPNSAWSIESVVAEAVGEVMGTRSAKGTWVSVFEEDSNGRFRRSAFAAQAALLSQLDKEEASLQAEVEELEAQVKERLHKALNAMPKKDEYTQRKSHELKVCSKKVHDAVEAMQRARDNLLKLSCEPGQGRVTQVEFNARCREVENCRQLQSAGETSGGTSLEEVMTLAAENRELMRRMIALGQETAPLRDAYQAERKQRSPRRRMSAIQSMQIQEKWKNRHLRQRCRELNVLRERVRMQNEDPGVSESGDAMVGDVPAAHVRLQAEPMRGAERQL